MTRTNRQRDGKLRLRGCLKDCPCLCHDTGGGVRELHPKGYCSGKEVTNAPERLEQYIRERDSKVIW